MATETLVTNELSIAPLSAVEQFKACEALQQQIWHSDPVEVIPAHLLITAQRHGGLVLGAFDAAGHMVGCLFGFMGYTGDDNPLVPAGQLQHCSHIMGVDAAWRGRGVGFLLKKAQWEWALERQCRWITWTYNPLELANATLNLGKLGAVCRCYLRDLYGPLPDGLNAGLPTDRFEVVWDVGSARVARRLKVGREAPNLEQLVRAGAQVLNPGRPVEGGWVEPGAAVRTPAGPAVLVEVPADFQGVKRIGLDLARAWQLDVRVACETAFAQGYAACDVVKGRQAGVLRAYYVLVPESELVHDE